MNQKVQGDGFFFRIQTIPSLIKSIKVFNQYDVNTPYVFDAEEVVKYSVSMDGIRLDSGNPNNIVMGRYEALSDTPDSTLLYLFELDSSLVESTGCALHIKTDTRDDDTAGANNTNGSLLYRDYNRDVVHKVTYDVSQENKEIMQTYEPNLTDEYFGKNSMSSIMSWNVASFDNLAVSDGKYDLSEAFVGENKTSQDKSFIASKEERYTVNNVEFVENVFYYDSYDVEAFKRNANAVDMAPSYLAVVCHYHVNALQYIFNLNLGNPATETYAEVGWEYIKFTCDWYFEIKYL